MSVSSSAGKTKELAPKRIDLVRHHLQEVMESHSFAGSKRAQDFLRLIVEHTLLGEVDALRERMIGVEMFGRPVAYDTANDSVVRVKASEVRKRLAQYYLECKRKPAVRIELPSGAYVARFRFESAATSAQLQHEVSSSNSGEQAAPISPEMSEVRLQGTPRFSWKKFRRPPLLFVGVVLGLGISALIGYRGFKWWYAGSMTPPAIRSIAVLPLENLSGDPGQDYFADGMTEELIAELGQVSALRVLSRTSMMTYKGTKKKVPEIARELGVDGVVEGSVLREGNQVRVTAELIDGRTDRHVWARTYLRDLTSVLALQGDVAQAIAGEVSIQVTPQEQARLAHLHPVNVEAQEQYLLGKYRLNLGDSANAITNFQNALQKDPNYAPADAALADVYGWLGEAGWIVDSEAFANQKVEASKAIALDDSLAEAHVELAKALEYLDWDWGNAEKEFKRALELNPNASCAHLQYSRYLDKAGRSREALVEMKLAQELDPFSSRTSLYSAYAFYHARMYDEALAQNKRAQELSPTYNGFPEFRATLAFQLGTIYAEKGMYAEAIREFKRLGDKPNYLGHLGNAYARSGRIAEARATIPKLKEHLAKDRDVAFHLAMVYAALGEKDEAFTWLEESYKARDRGFIGLKIDPCLDPLRSDPRFDALLRRVGFPT